MPIFKYECDNCGETTVAMHLSSEELLDCNICEQKNVLVRLLNKPFIEKRGINKDPAKTGEVTKKYIEENREILNQQKKEMKERLDDKS